jgi:hypothetical protein
MLGNRVSQFKVGSPACTSTRCQARRFFNDFFPALLLSEVLPLLVVLPAEDLPDEDRRFEPAIPFF